MAGEEKPKLKVRCAGCGQRYEPKRAPRKGVEHSWCSDLCRVKGVDWKKRKDIRAVADEVGVKVKAGKDGGALLSGKLQPRDTGATKVARLVNLNTFLAMLNEVGEDGQTNFERTFRTTIAVSQDPTHRDCVRAMDYIYAFGLPGRPKEVTEVEIGGGVDHRIVAYGRWQPPADLLPKGFIEGAAREVEDE